MNWIENVAMIDSSRDLINSSDLSGVFKDFSLQEMVLYLENPSNVAMSDGLKFETVISVLDSFNMLPLFASRLKESPNWQFLRVERRIALEKAIAKSKAGTSVFLSEIQKISHWLADAGIVPILLKGADLAIRYYDRPYLRPMSDIDLLFKEIAEADQARVVLLKLGYEDEADFVEGSPWRWNNYHLPAMKNVKTGGHVEIHGGVLFPLTDPKSKKAAQLYEEVDTFEWNGEKMTGLCPEANLLYLLSHTFVQHGGEPPAVRLLYDTQSLMAVEKWRFDWHVWQDLAVKSELLKPGLLGLAFLRHFNFMDLPKFIDVQISNEGGYDHARLSSIAYRSEQELQDVKLLFLSGQPEGLIVRFGRLLFPGADFMRYRYGNMRGWPLALLYPYRWVNLCINLVKSVAVWCVKKIVRAMSLWKK